MNVMYVGKTRSMHFIMKSTVQDITRELRGLIYQYCNMALHKKHKQISRQMSSKYDYFVCISFFYLPKNKKSTNRLSEIRNI